MIAKQSVQDIILFDDLGFVKMADSDEDFDNRRSGREKFQRERPADSGRDRRGSRDSWEHNDRNRTRSDG